MVHNRLLLLYSTILHYWAWIYQVSFFVLYSYSDNDIDSNGIQSLATALLHNSSLLSLDLSCFLSISLYFYQLIILTLLVHNHLLLLYNTIQRYWTWIYHVSFFILYSYSDNQNDSTTVQPLTIALLYNSSLLSLDLSSLFFSFYVLI